MQIREARPEDATAICDVLRQSITELCVKDHKNDPTILEIWLRNKTPESMEGLIADPAKQTLVATEFEKVLAVGAVRKSGEIVLNYVSPSARMRGISKKMLGALEARAKAYGAQSCTLESTATARQFYVSRGYREGEPVKRQFGLTTYPMSRIL